MSSATKRQAREARERMIVHPKGSKPLVRREIDYLLRNDRAKEAAGFVEPDMGDPGNAAYERFMRSMKSDKAK